MLDANEWKGNGAYSSHSPEAPNFEKLGLSSCSWDGWTILAKQIINTNDIPYPMEAFKFVLGAWAEKMENSPQGKGVWKTEIVTSMDIPSDTFEGKATLRSLKRKNVSKGDELLEWFIMGENVNGDNRQIFAAFCPVIPDGIPNKSSYLPFNYVKCNEFAYVMEADGQNVVTCQCIAHPFYEDSVPYMEKTAKRLLNKLTKWSVRYVDGENSYVKRVNHDQVVKQSMFRSVYNQLKDKYSFWATEWPESTDPVKFVFEDINIAAFLIALWRTEGFTSADVNFVDLGCGNGLLTSILIEEGYKGTGYDMRKRKIWSMYSERVKESLIECEVPLIPSPPGYPQVNWVIGAGNHTDEITPWIPFLSRACGPTTRFVIIPCCMWDFRGKYQCTGQLKDGRYRVYCNFIKEVCVSLGYTVKEEWLRIPSTRNLALIGSPRGDPIDNEQWISLLQKYNLKSS